MRRRFAIAVTAPKDGLSSVLLDATAMTQVFVNLLDNAMKYSGSCRQVLVTLRRCGDEVAVAVVDRGIGVAPDDQRRIFDEFYRSAAASERAPGTGLGLAIARHVVEAHRGRIEVESVLGQRTAFTVLLPVALTFAPQRFRVSPVVDGAQIEAGA